MTTTWESLMKTVELHNTQIGDKQSSSNFKESINTNQ